MIYSLTTLKVVNPWPSINATGNKFVLIIMYEKLAAPNPNNTNIFFDLNYDLKTMAR